MPDLRADHPLDHHHVPGPPAARPARRAAAAPRRAPRRRRTSTGRARPCAATPVISSSLPAGEPAAAQHVRGRRPTASARPAGAQPLPLVVGQAPEPLDVRRVLGAGEELQLAELHGLEAARRGEPLAELQEVLRRHRLQHVDLLRPAPARSRAPGRAGAGPTTGCRRSARPSIASRAVVDLVQQLLEPQLVDLVDGDEQQLVVRRRVGLEVLGVEQLRQPQVAAVGQLGALLAELTRSVSLMDVQV